MFRFWNHHRLAAMDKQTYAFLKYFAAFSVFPLSSLFLSCSPSVVDGFSASQIPAGSNRNNIKRQSSTSCFMSRSSRNNNNPFTSMLGDMASSILSGSKVSAKSLNPQLDSMLTDLGYPWETVQSLLESKQTPNERSFRKNLVKGYGEASPLHKLRLFDESNTEDSVRITFYRDSASWCPYCHKVWMSLEEKRIPYRVEKVNMRCYGEKTREFMQLQPNGQIPVAVIDGKVYGQSNDILRVLETNFPDHKSLQPAEDSMRASELLRLERQLFSTWLGWLTGPGNYRAQFTQVLKQVDNALASSGGPFFMGKDVSLVDIAFVPFLERMCASLLYFKGFMIRVPKGTTTDFPNVNKWFDALETLPSYQLTKSDYYTHCWDLPPQLGGCYPEPDAEPYRKAINGERSLDGTQGSWELPLQKDNGGVEPDWDFLDGCDEETAKREAAERLSANYDAIVKFASRGAGRKGMPPYMAPLADPNATPSEAVATGVDCVLQTVSMALLEGVTAEREDNMVRISKTIVKDGGSDYANGVIDSLAYLRDRTGVPRDMRLPAARQLRAHLNWSIEKILKAIDESK